MSLETRSNLRGLVKKIPDSELVMWKLDGIPFGYDAMNVVRNHHMVNDYRLVPHSYSQIRENIFTNLVFHSFFELVVSEF